MVDLLAEMKQARKPVNLLAELKNPAVADQAYFLEGDSPIEAQTKENTPPNNIGIMDKIKGTGEAALTMATGATGGMAGNFGGALEGVAKEVYSGEFGTPEAANRIEANAAKRAGQLTYAPRTESGQNQVEAIGEALAPLEAIPPAQALSLAQASKFAAPQVAAAGINAGKASASMPKLLVSKYGEKVAPLIKRSLDESALSSLQKANAGFNKGDLSAGAAQTSKEMQRATTSQNMPVPFEGDSVLTKGQVTRSFEQLQFEKETAKRGDIGAPLRDRASNQTATLIQNLDALAERSNPLSSEYRDIGRNVDSALLNRANALKAKERSLYKAAEDAGAMKAEIKPIQLGSALSAIEDMEDVTKNASAIKRIAVKRGFIDEDTGEIMPKSLEEIERFRQYVNNATDITDAKESRVRAIVVSAIDEATESAGDDVYQTARKFAAKNRREFENTGITKRLMSTKRGSTERQIAYEDIFKKVLLDSPIEEINKLRSTLLKSGPDGKQAWADIKAKGIEYIKESSQSFSGSDESGQALFSPDKFNRVVASLDKQNKLASIYGKRNAQVIRDLADLSNDLYTAPPGSVNFSNTASALQVALDSLGTFTLTGIPAPVATTIKESLKFVKNAKLKARISADLNYLKDKK